VHLTFDRRSSWSFGGTSVRMNGQWLRVDRLRNDVILARVLRTSRPPRSLTPTMLMTCVGVCVIPIGRHRSSALSASSGRRCSSSSRSHRRRHRPTVPSRSCNADTFFCVSRLLTGRGGATCRNRAQRFPTRNRTDIGTRRTPPDFCY
jgi:hypothetical protein